MENIEINEIDINEKWPTKCFWAVNLKIIEILENGKMKTRREVHLVDGRTVGEVEAKTKAMMKDTECEFSIMSIRKSNVSVIY